MCISDKLLHSLNTQFKKHQKKGGGKENSTFLLFTSHCRPICIFLGAFVFWSEWKQARSVTAKLLPLHIICITLRLWRCWWVEVAIRRAPVKVYLLSRLLWARIIIHSHRNMTNMAGIHHRGLLCLWLYYPARLLCLIVCSHTSGQ